MRLLAIGLCMLGVSASGVPARADESSPARRAYQTVSVAREKYDEVIWHDKQATPAQLRQIIAELDKSLAMLDSPLNHDLAEGDVFLRFRRVNILTDQVKLYARLGDTARAIDAWEQISRICWQPAGGMLLSDERVKSLLDDPRAAAIRAAQEAAARWVDRPALATPYREELPAEERVAGLSLIWSIARDGFVWFDHVPTLDWDRAYLEAIPKVLAAPRTEDYYRELMRFVALLGDGHSNVYAPQPLQEKIYMRPGVRVELIEGRVIATRIFDAELSARGLKIGDELLRVDNMPVREYAATRVAPYQSASTPQDHDLRDFTYALLIGDGDKPVALDMLDARGRPYRVLAPRSGYETTHAQPREAFALRRDGIAVLTARQFDDDAALKVFEQHFEEVIKAKGLIIDLRGNGGGSSLHGWNILSYLSHAPIPTLRSRIRDNSAFARAQFQPSGLIEWRPLASEPYAAPRERVFDGPVAVLINAWTFSAAEDAVASFQLMNRGAVIGVASGGSTGQPLLFNLPGGGTARICVKRDEWPQGGSFVGVGISPDVVVPVTLADVRHGRDAQLNAALAWIARQRGAK